MRLIAREIDIPLTPGHGDLLRHCARAVARECKPGEVPIRFALTRTAPTGYRCELGVIVGLEQAPYEPPRSIFDFRERRTADSNEFNAVLLVPTGVGAHIGGHAGDAGPVARLLAVACDRLITHPNVVNASDINELPENGLYVEGSLITRLLMGTAGLQVVRSNRVLVVLDDHPERAITELDVNAVSAARATLGMECPRVVTVSPPVRMKAEVSSSGAAVGSVDGLERLMDVLLEYRSEYDAVAISSVIDVPEGAHRSYFEATEEVVNPWGGVEAILTHSIAGLVDVPVAHSPMMETMEVANLHTGVVDPRKAAESVSTCFLHCILKGLHRAPRVVRDPAAFARRGVLSADDVACLVIPDGCVGLPTLAAMQHGIPVIAVRENRNRMRNDLTSLPFAPGKLHIVDTYLEAAGVMNAIRAGVSPASVRRPLTNTVVTPVVAQDGSGSGTSREKAAANTAASRPDRGRGIPADR